MTARVSVGRKALTALVALAAAAAVMASSAAAAPTPIQITSFDGNLEKQNGDPASEAGSHPWIGTTKFNLLKIVEADGETAVAQDLRNTTIELPPGFVGNPNLYTGKECSEADLGNLDGSAVPHCPVDSQVGYVRLYVEYGSGIPFEAGDIYPLYVMRRPHGTVALLGFNVNSVVLHVEAHLRTDSDYGITTVVRDASQTLSVYEASAGIWGKPADPGFDTQRGLCIYGTYAQCPTGSQSSTLDSIPFISLPTSCLGDGGVPGAPLKTTLGVTSWEGDSDTASFLSHDNSNAPLGVTECDAVPFAPTLQARPTTNVADSPSGLDVDIHIPQDGLLEPDGTASAALRDTTLTLPEGMTVNPAGANGLDGCSPSEAGLLTPIGSTPIHFSSNPSHCPNGAKLGTVEVDTPVLDHPIKGAVYLADPYDNPFESLLAIYISVDDPDTGIAATIAGKVTSDPVTGQLTTTVEENPQLPLEDIKVKLFGGSGGSLRTPPTCGTFQTTSSLTPWSAPDSGPAAVPSDSWRIEQGPSGSCANSDAGRSNSPSFDAGTVSPQAGKYSPFVLHLNRDDASQNFSAVTIKPPAGLVAKLAGVPACSDSALAAAATRPGRDEQANPSCPASSQVGSVVAGAGAGPAPYYTGGKVYMAGPYKGAPLSVAIVAPATAGPFDLGTVVVRTALQVDPKTTEITAVSDPIPSVLKGIPLDIRTVDFSLDRPQFSLNGTSCDPTAVTGQLFSTLGQVAALRSPFQLGECGGLPFKPNLGLRLKGGTKRGDNPKLIATLSAKAGEANIAATQVTLPRSAFLDQSHIRTVCTRVQFAADACPPGSVYGQAVATSPLLDYPLQGKVYLRSSDNKLPDLVTDLRGPDYQPIRIELSGRTDSFHGALRNTFDVVPDAPVSGFRLELFGGKRGLVVNSRNLCASTNRAKVAFDAHNGDHVVREPKVRAQCGHKGHRHSAK